MIGATRIRTKKKTPGGPGAEWMLGLLVPNLISPNS